MPLNKAAYLESLVIHNHPHPAELIEDFQFAAERGFVVAYKSLYMHRTTLKKRLKRLSNLLEMELWEGDYTGGGQVSELGRAFLDKFEALPD